MTSVKVKFHNIQSHSDTSFELKEGMNFILSNDNNVGKTTIFVTTLIIAKAPHINNMDVAELLRNGERTGYASYTYTNSDGEKEKVILRLTRENKMVRYYIEHIINGESYRSIKPPSSFYKALGIKVVGNSDVVNIIEADSLQLFVDEDKQCDSIVSNLLIDNDVENIKSNLSILIKQTARDIKDYEYQLDNIETKLLTISYNEMADKFNDESDYLEKIVTEVDKIPDNIDWNLLINKDEVLNKLDDFKLLDDCITICYGLQGVKNINTKSINSKDISILETSIQLVSELENLNGILGNKSYLSSIDKKYYNIFDDYKRLISKDGKIVQMETILDKVEQSFKACIELEKAVNYSKSSYMSDLELSKVEYNINSMYQILREKCKIVECPVKGKVYYGEKCISLSD